MNRHSSLLKLGLVFAIFAGLAFTCRNVDKSASSELSGYWYYAQAESEGSTTSASGHLILKEDGTFEDSRYLKGSFAGHRTGTYKISRDTLTLDDERSGSQTFTFYVGAAKDADNQKITTLTLKGKGLSYLLTKKV